MSNANFMKEAQDQKRNIAKFGGVPENEVVGWRSPFLEPVGDMQPHTLKKLGYTYDATLTFSKRSLKDKAPTPFTLDFGWPYDCKVKPCPKHRHFGFWEVPVVSLLDYYLRQSCWIFQPIDHFLHRYNKNIIHVRKFSNKTVHRI
jgi:hypothetical protein